MWTLQLSKQDFEDNGNIVSIILQILISNSLDEGHFPTALKSQESALFIERVIKRTLVTSDQSHYYIILAKSMKKYCATESMIFY